MTTLLDDVPAAARALRTALEGRAAPELATLIGAVDGDGAAWRRACVHAWREPALRACLATAPGLRSAVRRAAVGAELGPAIVDLLAQRVVARRPEAALMINDGVRLWLSDLLFDELAFDLEMDCAGGVPGDPEACPPRTRWRRFLAWAGASVAPARGVVAHPRWPGCFPAWGLASTSPALKPLIAALRSHPAGPARAGARVGLVDWWAGRLPAAMALAEWDDAAMPASVDAWQRARARDPWLATASLLARVPAADALCALAGAVRAFVEHALAGATRDGDDLVLPGLRRGAPVVRARRIGAALALEAEGLAGMLSWLGLVPARYDLRRGMACWDFASLLWCGWFDLIAAGHWLPVVIAPPQRWIALGPPAAAWMPAVIPAPDTRCAMCLDAAPLD
ncbi:MAG TPA: hypothetical protein VEL07_22365 [Planctomycetota bacterium]|nr:hypothetical protein [Planctomycetota bacterium]